MDSPEPPCPAPAAPALGKAEARDLAWRLVKLVETEDFAAAVGALEAEGPEALEPGRWRLVRERGLLELLQWYGFATDSDMEGGLAAAMAMLRPHAADAELRVAMNRFEKATLLPLGCLLEVPAELEAGFVYPFINMKDYWPRYGSWEKFHCDAAYPDDAECVVVRPSEPAPGPAPVILFLGGNAIVDDRSSIWGGCFAGLMQNEEVRRRFYVLHPKPTTASGTVCYTGEGHRVAWNEDAVWSLATEVLRRLGPERADARRLYVTGLSLGAQGSWRMAIKYGSHIAAIAPISGQCDWPGDTWRKGSGPSERVLENLNLVAVRAYQTDTDDYAGNPKTDLEWLAYDSYETTFDVQIGGLGLRDSKSKDSDLFHCVALGGPFPFALERTEAGEERRRPARPEELARLEVRVRKWARRWPGAPMELWWVKGHLRELEFAGGFHTSHILHYRVYTNPLWGLVDFFLEHQVPEDRCWRFDSPAFVADGSKDRRALEERWGAPLFPPEVPPPPLEVSEPFLDLWEVLGGEKEGGIIVRGGMALESPQEAERLATGSLVACLDLRDQRLHYELRHGTGPQFGWVSVVSSKGKQLLARSRRTAPLEGSWPIVCEGESAPSSWLRVWQKPGGDEYHGCLTGRLREDIFQVQLKDGMVMFDLPSDGTNVVARLVGDPPRQRLEDFELLRSEVSVPDSPFRGATAALAHELTHLRENRPAKGLKIMLVGAPPGQEHMIGWLLGAQRHLPADRRNDYGAYVDLHKNLGIWAEAGWELVPGSRPNRFKILMKHIEGLSEFFLGPRFMSGWYLLPQNDREVLARDGRTSSSTYVSVQNPKAFKDASLAEWELQPGRTPGAYKLKLAETPNSQTWVEGFWLFAMRFMDKDMRTERSTYTCVQSDSWDAAALLEWEFEPGSGPNLRRIILRKPEASNELQRGWYLNAVRQLTSDKRGDDSTFVSLQATVKNAKLAEWELIPTDEKNVYKIRLHSLPIQSPGPGWYLGTQCVNWPLDWRNKDSTWVTVQNAAVWPGAAEAKWELHPTGTENLFRVQLKHMPHRGNRSGCWLNTIRTIDKDTRNEHSTWASVISADDWAGAAGCEWAIFA